MPWSGLAVAAFVLVLIFVIGFLNSHDDVHTTHHGQDYNEIKVDYHGHPLYCVTYGHGASCDFQRWHQETGR